MAARLGSEWATRELQQSKELVEKEWRERRERRERLAKGQAGKDG